MPCVDRDAEVTLVVLVYRSLRWLDFVMQGVNSSQQETRYRWLVVANDATDEVRRDPRISIDYRNDNPAEFYINRVYRAWNEGVLNCPTQWCILLNSDMYGSDFAVDELVKVRRTFGGVETRVLPCGLLIEHGRIRSGMPEMVRDRGTNPDNFNRAEFLKDAESAQRNRGLTEPGRLFMPVLFDRQEFLDMGGYPEGNVGGVSGDKILFDKFIAAGFKWVTCRGSAWYHVQRGEQMWP